MTGLQQPPAAAPIPFGYLDRWTARPGESLELKVSSATGYQMSVVRLVQGDVSEDGPGHHNDGHCSPRPGRHFRAPLRYPLSFRCSMRIFSTNEESGR